MISTEESVRCKQIIQELMIELETKVLGKSEQVELSILAALSEGHLLIEDVPGVGKTTLARALSNTLGGEFKRIQCTVDLLPNDLTGVNIFVPSERRFIFQEGPLFSHIVLADELNRATPKAQSSLLEAMEEGQVTLDRETHSLPYPFWVIATQNPQSFVGTFQLPESQLDRFAVSISLGYLDPLNERNVLQRGAQTKSDHARRFQLQTQTQEPAKRDQTDQENRLDTWKMLIDARRKIEMNQELIDYMIELAQYTRKDSELRLGISTRAIQSWVKLCQARALAHGRNFVIPDDLLSLIFPALVHRIWFQRGENTRESKTEYLKAIVQELSLPR